jgi:hypothetical protein
MSDLRIIPYPEWEHLEEQGSGLSLNLSGKKRIKEYLIEKRHQVYPLT